MKLPQTADTLVLRTDFRDEESWEAVSGEIARSSCEGFIERYAFISDPAWADYPTDDLTSFAPPPAFFLVVDRMTLEHTEHPILAVCLDEEGCKEAGSAQTFRLIPAVATGFACNMNIANMDFWEFSRSVDSDGIFRGFI